MIGIGVLLLIISRLFFGLFELFAIHMILMFLVGICFFLSLPIAIVWGFIGRGDIVNGCMKCGNKWMAGEK